jgi:hypothetical protein
MDRQRTRNLGTGHGFFRLSSKTLDGRHLKEPAAAVAQTGLPPSKNLFVPGRALGRGVLRVEPDPALR